MHACKGVKDEVISEEILNMIADWTVNKLAGDVRKGKFLMSGAVDEAMEEKVSKITEEHLVKAFDRVKPMSLKKMLKNFLTPEHVALAGFVTQRLSCAWRGGARTGSEKPATTVNIYFFYKDVAKLNGLEPVGKTMMKKHLERLEASEIISHDLKNYPARGRTNVYYSNYDLEDLKKALKELGIKFPD